MSENPDINRRFYDEAYKIKVAPFALLHTLISYDQQSKSKRNIEQCLAAFRAETIARPDTCS